MDLRVNDALKRDFDSNEEEELSSDDGESAAGHHSDYRLRQPKIQVALLPPKHMRKKLFELIEN